MSALKIATTIVMYQYFASVAGKTREKKFEVPSSDALCRIEIKAKKLLN